MGNDKLLRIDVDLDALGIKSADLEAITSMQRAVAEAMRPFEHSRLEGAIESFTRQQDLPISSSRVQCTAPGNPRFTNKITDVLHD